MRDDVVELLLIVNDCVVDDDGDAVDAELTLTGGDNVEIELLRINVGYNDVVDECFELIGLRQAVDLLALGELLQEALRHYVHATPLCTIGRRLHR
jgi:hypothetical protein